MSDPTADAITTALAFLLLEADRDGEWGTPPCLHALQRLESTPNPVPNVDALIGLQTTRLTLPAIMWQVIPAVRVISELADVFDSESPRLTDLVAMGVIYEGWQELHSVNDDGSIRLKIHVGVTAERPGARFAQAADSAGKTYLLTASDGELFDSEHTPDAMSDALSKLLFVSMRDPL